MAQNHIGRDFSMAFQWISLLLFASSFAGKYTNKLLWNGVQSFSIADLQQK